MSIYSVGGFSPEINEGVFIAPNASVIGNVLLKKDSSVWFGTVIRGDIEKITIGENTNIQDLSMIHTSKPIPTIIGNGVTIGHGVILHSCTLHDNVLIGMGAIVLDGVVIGKNSVVAAGAVVPPGKIFPENSLIMGSPAKVSRPLTEEEKNAFNNQYKSYLKAKSDYLLKSSFKEING